jgi:hypothetical protein
MFVDDFDNFDRDVLGNEKVKRHADRWLEKWSVQGPQAGHESGRTPAPAGQASARRNSVTVSANAESVASGS